MRRIMKTVLALMFPFILPLAYLLYATKTFRRSFAAHGFSYCMIILIIYIAIAVKCSPVNLFVFPLSFVGVTIAAFIYRYTSHSFRCGRIIGYKDMVLHNGAVYNSIDFGDSNNASVTASRN